MRDITHTKVIEEQDLMNKLKQMIFKSFTHELKTPLNGILGSVENVKNMLECLVTADKKELLEARKSQFPEILNYLQTAESCAYIQYSIINDFLDYSHL
jgi:signal transduction histidine kinase